MQRSASRCRSRRSVTIMILQGAGYAPRFSKVHGFLAQRSAAQVRTEVRAIKKSGDEINKSRKTARAFLQKHGFITKEGKIGEHYR